MATPAAGFDLEWIVQTAFAVEATMGAYYAVFFLALVFTTESERREEAVTTAVILAGIYVGLGWFCNRQLGGFLLEFPEAEGGGGGLPEEEWNRWFWGWLTVIVIVVGGGLLTRWLLLGPLLKEQDDGKRESQITAAFRKNELVVWGLVALALALPFAYIWVRTSGSKPDGRVDRKARRDLKAEDGAVSAQKNFLELLGA